VKSEIITIFEDYPNQLPDYEKHLQNLYVLRDIIGRKDFSLQADGTLQVMHYVGFFQRGNTRIQILPKIYAKTDLASYTKTEINSSLDFIYRLIYWSGYLNHKQLSPQLQSSSESDLLEIFIGIFINEFNDLFRRKIYRTYEQQEENQQFIKGKILFSETVRRNPILKHLHFVRFDEYTINNPLNQIFKSLIFHLLNKTNSSNNKKKLVTGLTYLQDVDFINLYPNAFKKIKFDRLNTEFEPLFNLAKLFFHNQQPGLSEGKEKTFSFLLPIHLLFENFVAKILQNFSNTEFKFNYHKPRLPLALHQGVEVFWLEPDFTITYDDNVITILDTKYKFPFDKDGNVDINTSDLYQLSTYALRYNCKSLFLIYPKFLGSCNEQNLLAEYKIQSSFNIITLRVLQIDIMEDDLTKISEAIKKVVYSRSDFMRNLQI
jgi:5-methylcytosine-specific restriction enzyme subunit McrC